MLKLARPLAEVNFAQRGVGLLLLAGTAYNDTCRAQNLPQYSWCHLDNHSTATAGPTFRKVRAQTTSGIGFVMTRTKNAPARGFFTLHCYVLLMACNRKSAGLQSHGSRYAIFRRTISGPTSSYSSREMHEFSNEDKLAKMEPPTQGK